MLQSEDNGQLCHTHHEILGKFDGTNGGSGLVIVLMDRDLLWELLGIMGSFKLIMLEIKKN